MIRTINSIACSREEDCDNCPIKNECDEIEYGTSSFNLWAIYEKALKDLTELMYQKSFIEDSEMQKWDSGCWIRYKLFENCVEQLKKGKKE